MAWRFKLRISKYFLYKIQNKINNLSVRPYMCNHICTILNIFNRIKIYVQGLVHPYYIRENAKNPTKML